MRGAVLCGPRDVRFEDRETPKIIEPTDAVIRIAVTCVCGSDLWPYRGLQAIDGPTPMGHEYCGLVEQVGSAVTSIKPGQFVVGSFATSDNTCPHCLYGYKSSCVHREFIDRRARGGDVLDWHRTGHCRPHDTRGLLSPVRQPAAGGRFSRSCNESSRQW
jgi:threonine dehydrogenase-like Zn-dependent dehydrogenase